MKFVESENFKFKRFKKIENISGFEILFEKGAFRSGEKCSNFSKTDSFHFKISNLATIPKDAAPGPLGRSPVIAFWAPRRAPEKTPDDATAIPI